MLRRSLGADVLGGGPPGVLAFTYVVVSLIGRFFSQTDSREEKKDLLIMVTPHIVRE